MKAIGQILSPVDKHNEPLKQNIWICVDGINIDFDSW